DARMLAEHCVICGRLRPLPRPLVLRLVITLDDGATPLGVGFDTLGAHRTRTALGDREGKAPAVPPLGSLAVAGSGPTRTADFIPRIVEDEGGGLEQPRRGGQPGEWGNVGRRLRPVRVVTQGRKEVPPVANRVDRETGDIVAVDVLFAHD